MWVKSHRRTIDAVATPTQRSADAARQLADQMREAAAQTGRVRGVGSELRKPFDEAVGSLQGVIDAAANRSPPWSGSGCSWAGWCS